MLHRGFAFDLHPTPDQAERLGQFIGVARLVYNLALEQRRDFHRQYRATTGRSISWPSQSREVTELRREHDWIAAVPRVALEQALRDLDRAYCAFFAGRARYPTPRKRGVHNSIRFQGVNVSIRPLNAKWAEAKIPSVGRIRFRMSRPVAGVIRNATLTQRGLLWRVSFNCEIEHEAPANSLPSVGVDRGVANAIALSTGELIQIPQTMKAIEKRRRKAQKVLARRKRGSARYAKARRRAASLAAREVRIRRDFSHRASTDIARRFGVVAIEDLNITNMTASAAGTVEAPGRNVVQKAGLNREILARGWRQFENLIAYKLEASGGRLVKVPAAYTSQTCSACGVVDARSRKSQATFVCVHCGHEAHADTNAAIEILRRSTALMRAEGVHFASDETRTCEAAWAVSEPASAGDADLSSPVV